MHNFCNFTCDPVIFISSRDTTIDNQYLKAVSLLFLVTTVVLVCYIWKKNSPFPCYLTEISLMHFIDYLHAVLI